MIGKGKPAHYQNSLPAVTWKSGASAPRQPLEVNGLQPRLSHNGFPEQIVITITISTRPILL
jgi:hypothetical protein